MPVTPVRPDQQRHDPEQRHDHQRRIARLGISIEQFAEAVGISRTSAYAAAQRGEFPVRRVGRRLIVPVAAVERWLSGDDKETRTW